MDEVLQELIGAARRAGLRIGTAEALDAQRAAAAVGVAERAVLRAALTASLVKRPEDQAPFLRVFDRFFRADTGGRAGALDRLRAEGVDPATLDELQRRFDIGQQQAGGGGGGLDALLEGGAELDRRIEEAMRDAGVARMVSPMQVGLFSTRTLDALGIDGADAELAQLAEGLDPRIGELLAASLEALRRRVRAAVREDFARRNPARLEQSRAERLDQEAFIRLDKDELAQVQAEVRRLGRLLRDRMERNRRRARQGRLDVRATARAAARTGGVPFTPVFRRRHRQRPRLVVLCDVSDSVRQAARFLLVLVYSMQEAFSRTRSFVFVGDVGETTALFDHSPIEEAIERAFRGDTVNVGASSDYGRSFARFVDQHLDALDPKTTLLILGDARNNRNDPEVEALKRMRERCARVVWLNPEPRASWGVGDSEMQRYLPFITFSAPVRTLAELRVAVTRLASVVGR
ncbi:MAG: VWA domain-containing protein [Sandaracinaceae bacterium]|nr:VWA domain-containing protein [Sandaracinaceae bacterium]